MRIVLTLSILLSSSVAWRSSFCAEDAKPGGVVLVLQQPEAEFEFGDPIQLTAVFQNNLARDVTIWCFSPQRFLPVGHLIVCYSLPKNGKCVSTYKFISGDTCVSIKRIAGKRIAGKRAQSLPTTLDFGRTIVLDVDVERFFDRLHHDIRTTRWDPPDSRSFVLKPGASVRQTFDLMQTPCAASHIDSPGIFEVSLVHQTSSSDWEGELRAAPIKITVVDSAR